MIFKPLQEVPVFLLKELYHHNDRSGMLSYSSLAKTDQKMQRNNVLCTVYSFRTARLLLPLHHHQTLNCPCLPQA